MRLGLHDGAVTRSSTIGSARWLAVVGLAVVAISTAVLSNFALLAHPAAAARTCGAAGDMTGHRVVLNGNSQAVSLSVHEPVTIETGYGRVPSLVVSGGDVLRQLSRPVRLQGMTHYYLMAAKQGRATIVGEDGRGNPSEVTATVRC
jgi:hypothetical protein